MKAQIASHENSIPLTHLVTCSIFLKVPDLHLVDVEPVPHFSTRKGRKGFKKRRRSKVHLIDTIQDSDNAKHVLKKLRLLHLLE